MLKLIEKLLCQLESTQIKYCHWKNNHALGDALQGNDDLDLLVEFSQRAEFYRVIYRLGFKEASNRIISYPYIYHFYGLDKDSCKIVHLHIHFKIITGESHLKNFHLPMENVVLNNSEIGPEGIRVPDKELQLILYLIRYYLKISCIPGILLLNKNKDYIDSEFRFVNCSSGSENVDGYLENNAILNQKLFWLLYENYSNSLIKKAALGIFLRFHLSFLRRHNPIYDFILRYFQISYRAVNKLFLHKKKSFNETGLVVAVTGLDATGKSTVTASLTELFQEKFNCKYVHVGIPPATISTYPFRILLNIRNMLKRHSPNLSSTVPSRKRNFLFALRYTVLAFERYCLIVKVYRLKLKGYIVICDRFPSLDVGKMDSPRIGFNRNDNKIIRLIGKIEGEMYKRIPKPDIVFNLQVPIEIALERNRERIKSGKETDTELRCRYAENSNLTYDAHEFYEVDTTCSLSSVIKVLLTEIWKKL
ncbi:MAG: hypothetical protein GY737_25945 [Desulfobacteraceae bacterium]|nr:hypothetical protein [Desulfobacteraceae bacterium]